MTTKSVESFAALPCDAVTAWNKVCFYEHGESEPSLLLKLVLPTPDLSTGCFSAVGDSSRCVYSDGGYLTKRIVRLDPGKLVEFEITEQSIRYHEHVILKGGFIRIVERDDGTCAIRMMTEYESRLWPGFAMDFLIARVVRAVHRVVIDDMRLCLAGSGERDAQAFPDLEGNKSWPAS